MINEKLIEHFRLRYYQIEAIGGIFRDWAEGIQAALVSLPTGTGKTRVFTAVSTLAWKPGERLMVIAHTEELVDQPKGVFESLFSPVHPEAKLGIVRAEHRDYSADVIFSTVQTLYQNGYELSLIHI